MDFSPNSVSFERAEEKECKTIKRFFYSLVKVYQKKGLKRHVVFSTYNNVAEINNESQLNELIKKLSCKEYDLNLQLWELKTNNINVMKKVKVHHFEQGGIDVQEVGQQENVSDGIPKGSQVREQFNNFRVPNIL